jgi:threonyl-tRNA synthetase
MDSIDLFEGAQVASDHRELNRRLDLYSTSDEIGPGLILWHPNGALVRHLAERFSHDAHLLNGYELVYTPHVGKARLWEKSGHLANYGDKMFQPMSLEEDAYYVKPMNCPFHVEIFKSRPRSYRDLPKRFAEFGTVYRFELSGVLHGLSRARGFTVDDSHIFCRADQAVAEIEGALRFSLYMLRAFGFDDVSAFVATRPEGKAIGALEEWERATGVLWRAGAAVGLACREDPGGGAFYGPKIDLKVRDAHGREWQLSTVQFDFNLPERFGLEYVGPNGRAERPVMVHRALFGSFERFFGILVEHHSGAFPVWLAPVQVSVLPVAERHEEHASAVAAGLRDAGARVELLASDDRVPARVRDAELRRVPFVVVVGDREVESGRLSVRRRDERDVVTWPAAELVAALAEGAKAGVARRL